MQVGVSLPNFSKPAEPSTLVEVAQAAEQLGFDSIWTTDHVIMPKGSEEPYGHIYELLTTLAYLAPLTERVRLGTSVLVFPPRNPILIAKETATLDALSGGRLILGVGAGWNRQEFEWLGSDFANRGERLDEYIAVLRELWNSEDPRFEGRHVRFGDVVFSPRPRQPNGPPIWLGGSSKHALRRAATIADGWHPVGVSLEVFRAGMEATLSQANGREVIGTLRARVTPGRVLPETKTASGQVMTVVDGDPEKIVTTIMAYQEAGLDHLVAHFGDNTRQSILSDMRRFAEEIRPALGAVPGGRVRQVSGTAKPESRSV